MGGEAGHALSPSPTNMPGTGFSAADRVVPEVPVAPKECEVVEKAPGMPFSPRRTLRNALILRSR